MRTFSLNAIVLLMGSAFSFLVLPAHAAGVGDPCELGMNVPTSKLCPFGTTCLKSISNYYCSNAINVCGWSGTSGYSLGAQKTYQNNWYECFLGGFQKVLADGASCTSNSQCKNHLCSGSPGNMVCGNPPPPPAPPSVQTRTLTPAERSIAQSVFGNSVNLDFVHLTNTLGAQERPWTTNSPPFYTVNVGPAFNDMTSEPDRRELLIHELSHVWQGQHGVPFMANSGAHQTLSAILNGGDPNPAYAYTPGANWSTYNVEQQASIVEDWYRGGMTQTDPRWPYIIWNIRHGNTIAPYPVPAAPQRRPMTR